MLRLVGRRGRGSQSVTRRHGSDKVRHATGRADIRSWSWISEKQAHLFFCFCFYLGVGTGDNNANLARFSQIGQIPAKCETRAIDRPPETRVCGRLGKRPSATACLAMARWKEAGVAAASCTASVAHSLLWSTSAPWPAAGCSASTMDSGGAPGWSEAVESAALEAAGSSTRGSGWASSGLASSWECRAAQSR